MAELGVRELREQLADVIGRAQHGGQTTEVLRNGKLAARVVPPDATVIGAAEAGGDPRALAAAAAEAIRAANHATINRKPVRGLAAAADAYSTAGELYRLVATGLPQLVRQLADLVALAEQAGTLTGPQDAPGRATEAFNRAAATLETAGAELDAGWQALSPVGGWLGEGADALIDDEED